MKIYKFTILILFLLISCDNNSPTGNSDVFTCEECYINITNIYKQLTPLIIDENGYYHFDYNDNNASDYGTVYYETSNPTTYVQWASPDSFYVIHMGQTFWEPVINYGTYSNENGEGQQLFYVNSTLIGDTLDLYGYLASYTSIIDSAKVIID